MALTVKLDFTVRCAKCNNGLDASFQESYSRGVTELVIIVAPCETCLEEIMEDERQARADACAARDAARGAEQKWQTERLMAYLNSNIAPSGDASTQEAT